MLGLAMRAGRVIIGTEQACIALKKKGKVKLVLLASDASANTKKKMTVKCEFYSVSHIELTIGSAELGSLLGKSYGPMTLALTDEGFAREIAKACAEI